MELICFIVAIIATTIGASSGIGGGVIIKPVLESMNIFTLPTVNFLSSATIFAMAVVSIAKQIKQKDKINFKNTSILAIGSIIGGIVGQKILRVLVSMSKDTSGISILQSIMLIVLLLFVFIYMRYKNKLKTYNLKNRFIIILIGIVLGAIAAFLGIGGGPINVAIFAIFFEMEAKEAARNSIIVIFFSQGAKILSVAFTTGFAVYNLTALPLMIIGGILGGFIGYKLNKTVSEKNILRMFNIVLILIILVNIYNIIAAL